MIWVRGRGFLFYPRFGVGLCVSCSQREDSAIIRAPSLCRVLDQFEQTLKFFQQIDTKSTRLDTTSSPP